MSASPRWPVLAVIGLLAFTLRSIYIWQISRAPFFDLRLGDAAEFDVWARSIAAGDWIGKGVFYVGPLYAYFVAGVYRTLGDSAVTLRLVQAFVGSCSCALLAATGMALCGRRGAMAGVLLALYPPAIFLEGTLEKTCLTTFLIVALLYLMATLDRPERILARPLAMGVALGLLALTRENALLLILPVLLWVWAREGSRRRRAFVAAAAVIAGCAFVLLPVGIRNYAVGGEFHLTSSQFGANFYIGNHPGATGSYDALVIGHGSWEDERADATRLAEQEVGHPLSASGISSFWTNRALAFIRSQPAAWGKLLARKLALTFNAAEAADTESQDLYADWSSVLRLLSPFNFGVLLALAAAGVVLTWQSRARLWFLYAVGLTYAVSLAAFYVVARYRFPIVPVLMLLGAGALSRVWSVWQEPSSTRVTAPRVTARALAAAVVVAACALAVAHLPLENRLAAKAVAYANVATVLSRDGTRLDQAMEFYRRSIDAAPDFPAAQAGLAALLVRSGRPEEAIPHFQTALQAWPGDAEARYNFGVALGRIGHPEKAVEQFSEALRLRPDDVEIRTAFARTLNNVGGALADAGRVSEAVPYFERAVQLNPNDENARRNLDTALEMTGR